MTKDKIERIETLQNGAQKVTKTLSLSIKHKGRSKMKNFIDDDRPVAAPRI
jgi:hypothetical protein